MKFAMGFDPLWLLILAAFCLSAAVMDISLRRIPNLLCFFALVAGMIFAWQSNGLSGLALHSSHTAIALVVGMGLFAAGMIGGGDAKFYAATAMWFSLPDSLRLLLAVSLSGLVAILLWMAGRRLFRTRWGKNSDDAFAKFPYGVAIGLGAVLAAL